MAGVGIEVVGAEAGLEELRGRRQRKAARRRRHGGCFQLEEFATVDCVHGDLAVVRIQPWSVPWNTSAAVRTCGKEEIRLSVLPMIPTSSASMTTTSLP